MKIGILGLNSSWWSSSDADYGKLLCGERQIRKALEDSEDVNFRLAIIHHPFEWLRDFERGHVDAYLIDNCDFILHGHTHRQGILEFKTPDGQAVIIPAGASYESRNYPNSYNFVKLNLEEQNGTIYFRIYSDNGEGFWTLDATSFRNVKDGTYTFKLPHRLVESSDLKQGIKDSKATLIEPYFGNPYPMKGNFVGRVKERKLLTKWLTEGEEQIFALTAIGGTGKTSLAWSWLHRDIMGKTLPGMLSDKHDDLEACRLPKEARLDGIFWWSFYERESFFDKFIDEALIYTCKNEEIGKTRSVQEKVKKLVDALRGKRFLFILDGFERELLSYSSLNAAYQEDITDSSSQTDFRRCTDLNADTFLRWAASGHSRSRILITSRHLPLELDNASSCGALELTGLDPADAIRYVQSMKIKGTQDEIGRICENYAYHPLALQILVGMIIYDPLYPRDIKAANYYNPIPDLKQREHHILELAYNQLAPKMKELLSRVAAFRSMIAFDAIKIINPFNDEDQLRVALRELIERSLFSFDQERGLYNLHPVVREYAYMRLKDKEIVHNQLRGFYSSRSNPKPVRSIEDLKDIIELYHHTVKAGLYDEAFGIYKENLITVLFHQLGAYQIDIKLLEALFPDGKDLPPRLREKNDQGSVLNSLALCYGRVGQLKHSESIFKIALPFAQNEIDKATCLGNLSNVQMDLGKLKAAKENLSLKVDTSKILKDIRSEVFARASLSLLLAYCGDFAGASKELQLAEGLDIELRKKARNHMGDAQIFHYRTLINLIACKINSKYISLSLRTARKALQIVKFTSQEPLLIEVKLALTLALLATYLDKGSKRKETLEEAEKYLQEVTVASHIISRLEKEPEILIAWSHLYLGKGDLHQAKIKAEEALFIAERCELRLKQAEIHNFLAQLAVKSKELSEAKKQALIGRGCKSWKNATGIKWSRHKFS